MIDKNSNISWKTYTVIIDVININLDDELLSYQDKNPLDWLIQLNKTQKQITIQNISEKICLLYTSDAADE